MSSRRTFRRYLLDICLGEKLPVWATIAGVVVGVGITAASSFWIVPAINSSLEKQKIRTEFVIRNLDDLNSRTRSLMSDISDLQNGVLNAGSVDPVAIQRAVSKIAEMQWKAIELAIIFEGSKGAKSVDRYQHSLDEVRKSLQAIKTKSDLANSQAAAERFSADTLDVIRELAALGGLRVSTKIPAP